MQRARFTFVTFLAGGIGSGKSTVARLLAQLGARRIDLDRLSREVLAPATQTTLCVAKAFGADLVDGETGELDRRLLAERAFSTPEATALLERIELPAIRERLREELAQAEADGAVCCVVEVPLLDRLGPEDLRLADEVMVVTCPLARRRARAVRRGMTAADFDARAARQPDDAWLIAHADTVIDNEGGVEELEESVRIWWDELVATRCRLAK